MPVVQLPFPTLLDALVWIVRRGDRAFRALENGEPFTLDMDAHWLESDEGASAQRAVVTGEFDVAMKWLYLRATWQGGELHRFVAQVTRGDIDPELRDRVLPKLALLETTEWRNSFWTHMVTVLPHLADAIAAEWSYKPPPVMEFWTDPPQWPTLGLVEAGYQMHVDSVAFQASVLSHHPPGDVFAGPLHRLTVTFTRAFAPYLLFIHEHVKLALQQRPDFERQLDELERELISMPLRPLFDSGEKRRAWQRFRRIVESIHEGDVPPGAAVPVAIDGSGATTWQWRWGRARPRATAVRAGDQDKPDEKGFVEGPADPTAYVPVMEILNEHVPDEWGAMTEAKLNGILKWNTMIRRHSPRAQRLNVHLSDWYRFTKANPERPRRRGSGTTSDPDTAEIARQKMNVRAAKGHVP